MKTALAALEAKQRDRYSWIAQTAETYVFTTEIDLIEPENNNYDHHDGVYKKYVPPMSKELGFSSLNITHAQELIDAVTESNKTQQKCRLLLVKGTKLGKTPGGIKAAVDGDFWQVTELTGTNVAEGFGFTLERVG